MSRRSSRIRSVVWVCTVLMAAAVCLGVADRRFDVATLNCSPPGSADHFCDAQFNVMNWTSANGHFLCMGTDNKRADINGAGNFMAAYFNDLTGLYGTYNGTQAADQIENYVLANFTSTGVKPTWLVLNEISGSLWPTSAPYRAWLRTCIARLKTTYNHEVILFSPFQNPGANGADWTPLSQNCYIAIECYLSGQEVNASGNSQAWCEGQYAASKQSYINLGVAASKLYLAEHFGQTLTNTGWGRSGVSYAGWDNAIRTRARAAHAVGFAGFIGYAWGKNAMLISEADQIHFQQTYRAETLP